VIRRYSSYCDQINHLSLKHQRKKRPKVVTNCRALSFFIASVFSDFPEHFFISLPLFPAAGQACRKKLRQAPAREEKSMNCILELLIVLFEVIQDTGTGT